ncbi:glycosyltransferase, partial [Paraburkholderia azotifigens]|uniref:glycosyltransferase n=1 Tax=Paraburkholderia azotifigens TaxID=2057004 RepID=UPI0031765386
PGAGVEVRGVVAGSERVAHDTNGAINGFGSASQSLPLRLMAARRALRREIREQRPDVISSHFALYTFPGLDVTRGIPQISHFHGPWAEESHVEGPDSLGRRMKSYLEQTVYARSSRLIVLSDAFGRILTSRYGIPADRVRVVPGCVNVDQFNLPLTQNEARLRLQLPLGRPIVLAVRRLVRRMGLEDLIDAV